MTPVLLLLFKKIILYSYYMPLYIAIVLFSQIKINFEGLHILEGHTHTKPQNWSVVIWIVIE